MEKAIRKGSIINKDELKDAAKSHFLNVLDANSIEIKGGKSMGRIDILCPSPQHGDKHTGNCVANIDNRCSGTVHCFACGYHADAYKLTADIQFGGENNDVEVWEFLAPYIGTPVKYADGSEGATVTPRKIISPKERLMALYSEEENPADFTWQDYSKYYMECYKNLSNSKEAIAYLKKRGITGETAKRFKLGFDPNYSWAPRVIVPVTKNFFLARDIRPDLTEKQDRFAKMKPKGAYPALFNSGALKQSSKPVFIVEGELDAISIMQCGFEAIALGGLGNYNKLIKAMLRNKEHLPIIVLALDADEPGRKATRKIKKELETLELCRFGVNAFYCNADTKRFSDALYGLYCKDANEAMVENEPLLKRKLDIICQRAKELAKKSA